MLDPATLYHMIPQVGSSTVGLVQREGHCGRVTAGGSLWEGHCGRVTVGGFCSEWGKCKPLDLA